jgi:hypothetical protein
VPVAHAVADCDRVEAARQQTTYNQPTYASYYLASDMDFARVPILTTPRTPVGPEFKDREGTDHDEVQIPFDPAFSYYVDGELVEKGKSDAEGEVTVVAVPKAWASIAEGAETEWTVTFEG